MNQTLLTNREPISKINRLKKTATALCSSGIKKQKLSDAGQPLLHKTDVVRSGRLKPRTLLEIGQYPSKNVLFYVGDTVRSYRSAFDNIQPFKNNYIEGVVISISDKVLGEDYLVVRWHIDNYFGNVSPCKLPHNGSDTFPISRQSPHLVKVNNGQLALPFP